MAYSGYENVPGLAMGSLPLDAQELYRMASAQASDTYADPALRHGSSSPEEFAHRVAWTLVNLLYEKGEDGHWHEREIAHEVISSPSDGNVRWLQVAQGAAHL